MKQKLRHSVLIIAIIVLAGSTNNAFSQTPNGYVAKTIEGWQLYINPILPVADSSPYPELISLLQCKLHETNLILPPKALEELKKVPIFLELNDTIDTKDPLMAYHGTKEWLQGHHLNVEKARSIEISNAKNFVSWGVALPASLLLTGLSWAYYDRVLGFGNQEIANGFKKAVASKLYDSVLNIYGLKARSAAMIDERNFFAAMTMSYFDVGTYFPFVRGELFATDRATFDLIKHLWGLN